MIKSLKFSSIFNPDDGYYHMRFNENIKYKKSDLVDILLKKNYLDIAEQTIPFMCDLNKEKTADMSKFTKIGKVIDIDIGENNAAVEIDDKYKDFVEQYDDALFGFVLEGEISTDHDKDGKRVLTITDITGFQFCYEDMKTFEEIKNGK